MKSQEISGISGSGNRKFRICLVEALMGDNLLFSVKIDGMVELDCSSALNMFSTTY